MILPFTKMHGAGNDFVVIDETKKYYNLQTKDYVFLADRRFGIGADQILSVRASTDPLIDFEYVIHNADGSEVEHCGNGARCFLKFVRQEGLSTKQPLVVKVKKGTIELVETQDGLVSVNMGVPSFNFSTVGFISNYTTLVADFDYF